MTVNSTSLRYTIEDLIYIFSGIGFSGFALKSFLVPNNFLDGGVTGLSLLLHEFTHINLALILVLANIPLIIMGAFQINLRFAFKTFACVCGLAMAVTFVPYPIITSDKLLVAIFGGFFMGTGIGLVMRAGCALDGIEVLALYTWKRSSFTITEIILGMNVLIFLIAAIHFGLESALYSMLTYFTASRTIEYVVEGLEEYTGVTIISAKSEEIKRRIVMDMGKGIAVYKGERGFFKDSFDVSHPSDFIFTIITRLEMRKLKNLISDIDPNAFVFSNSVKEAAGGILKRRAGHDAHH